MSADELQAKSSDSAMRASVTPTIQGVGMTKFTSIDERSLPELLRTATERALADGEMSPNKIDSIHVGNMAAEAFNNRSGLANALAAELGVTGLATRIENTSASGASAFQDAINAVHAGRSSAALAVGGEKMSAVDTATSTEIISRITHDCEKKQGITLPSFAGLAADRYLRIHEGTRRDLAQVAVKSHANAAANPFAQFTKRIEVNEVVDSPAIAVPLRLFDCCPNSDGAAAVLITDGISDETVRVTACESAVGTHAVADRANPLDIESVRLAGKRAYKVASVTPEDIDVACIHDAFSILEWLEMEELGFAETGEAWRLTREGQTDIDGGKPINPGGGLKARGHPLGATGISQVIELVWQLRGEVQPGRAVDNPEVGLAVNVAGFGNNSVCTLLEVGQ
jgi:acetyl-CoA C-acetyltransferase